MSKNKYVLFYETVDEKNHVLVKRVLASGVDYKTALMLKRNHKKICAVTIHKLDMQKESSRA